MITLYRFSAETVFYFHVAWIVALPVGFFVLLFHAPYAPVFLAMIMMTGIANLLCRWQCPLTLLENVLRRQYDRKTPEVKSFVALCIRKATGISLTTATTDRYLLMLGSISSSIAIAKMIY